MIYVCIPVHNRLEYTRRCLLSLRSQTYTQFRVILCDDGSTDGTAAEIRQSFPEVTLIEGDGKLWWTGATNRCVQAALTQASDEDFIYTLNNDTELYPETLGKLIEAAEHHNSSIIGTVNLFYDSPHLIENSAFVRRAWGLRRLHKWAEPLNSRTGITGVDGLAGKGVLIPVRVFKKTGLYKEKELPHYHADLEFTIRAKRNGFRVFLSYDARLRSHQSLSGTGSVTSVPSLKEFATSFFQIKSTHHLPSLFNYHKNVNGKAFLAFFARDLIFINLGFLKRYSIHIGRKIK